MFINETQGSEVTTEATSVGDGAGEVSEGKKRPTGLLGKGEFLILDPNTIETEDGFNPRSQDMGDMDSFTRSVRTHGVKVPVEVRREDGKYILIGGHRRLAAALKSGLAQIPAILTKKVKDTQTRRVHALVTNTQKELMPVEEALAFKALVDGGMSPKEIARSTGRSLVNVKERLQLAEGDAEVLDAVKTKKVSAGLGAAIVNKSKGNKKKQKALVRKAKASKEGKRAVHVDVGLNAPDNKRKLLSDKYEGLFAKEVKTYNSKRNGPASKIEKLPTKIGLVAKRARTQRATALRIGFLAGVVAASKGKL